MARRKIKDVISKPSQALKAMADGLRKQSQRPDFKIDMTTYGRKGRKGTEDEGLCFGCAATCAVQEIASIDLSCDVVGSKDGRAKTLGFHKEDELKFEAAIDQARKGSIGAIFNYFRIPIWGKKSYNLSTYNKLPTLTTSDWHHNLKYYDKFITRLEKAGY